MIPIDNKVKKLRNIIGIIAILKYFFFICQINIKVSQAIIAVPDAVIKALMKDKIIKTYFNLKFNFEKNNKKQRLNTLKKPAVFGTKKKPGFLRENP